MKSAPLSLALAVAVAACASAAPLSDWQRWGEEIMARQWSAVQPPAWLAGPPQVRVVDDGGVNCYVRLLDADPAAGSDKARAEICVLRGLVEAFLMDGDRPDLDAFAGVLGHELAHLVLEHHFDEKPEAVARLREADAVIRSVVTREDEFQADVEGMRIAARAGYDPHGLVRSFERGRARLGDEGLWEMFEGDHPSFTQRLAEIDRQRADLWRSVLDFEVGVDLLRGGNYACARECFRSALAPFPAAPEVLCNLGYALLMDYYHRLPPEYWTAHDIGQPLPVGFAAYLPVPPRRSRSAEEMAGLRRMWEEAVGSLERAVEGRPDYALALGNLGFAYLIGPDGPRPDRAREFLERFRADVASGAPTDEAARVEGRVRLTISNNLALVASLEGRPEEALRLLRDSASLASAEAAGLFAGAPVVNLCLILAESPRREDQERAAADLEQILPRLPAGSAEWQYARGRYLHLCRKLGREPLPDRKLSVARAREMTPHLLYRETPIYLGDSQSRLWRILGAPDAVIPLAVAVGESEPGIQCWRYGDAGLELVFLRATLLRVKVLPARGEGRPCRLSLPGPGGGEVGVGETAERLEQLLGFTWDDAIRLGEDRPYRLYSPARLAVLVQDGIIRSLALAGVR